MERDLAVTKHICFMKTIEVTDEMYDQLIELATEMTTQDPRGTRMPHLFQIRDKKKIYHWDTNGDTKIWVDTGEQIEIETLEELKDYLSGYHDITNPKNLDAAFKSWLEGEIWGEMISWGSEELELDKFLEKYCPDLKQRSYSWEEFYHNAFLTAKACKEHIRLNHYHYTEPVDYLNDAWRNPEAELVSTFLCGLVGKQMHR